MSQRHLTKALWLCAAATVPVLSVGWGVLQPPAVIPGGPRVAALGGSVLAIPAQCPDKAAT